METTPTTPQPRSTPRTATQFGRRQEPTPVSTRVYDPAFCVPSSETPKVSAEAIYGWGPIDIYV